MMMRASCSDDDHGDTLHRIAVIVGDPRDRPYAMLSDAFVAGAQGRAARALTQERPYAMLVDAFR
jgi:hypothetical protein